MGSLFYFDDFELDVGGGELRRGGTTVKVHALTLRLLDVFVRNPGKLVTKSELFAHAWDGRTVSDNSLTVAIGRMRKALDEKPGESPAVMTVHGRGYRFLREVSSRESPSVLPPARRQPMAFVGRDAVMSQLRSALVDARKGSGGLIVLSGESGSGKTRVAEVLAGEAADSNFSVAWAYCRELGQTSPLWPIVGLLRDLFERLGPFARDVRFRAFAPDLALLLPELSGSEAAGAVAGAPTLTAKHRVFAAVVRLLGLAAEKKPLLIVLDDLQAADAATLELLFYLLPEVVRTRVLLLATVRPAGEAPLARILGHRNCTRISIHPLSPAEVANYLAELHAAVDETLTQAVYDLSEGNPFYVREIARQLHKRPRANALRVPHAALELMRERLAPLSAAALELLTCAAVIGRSFSLPLLQAVELREATDVIACLDEGVASGVIVRKPESASDFSFTHELQRVALCGALKLAERRSWHLRVLRAVEQRRACGDGVVAELAHHAWCALPEGDLRKTVEYCSEAARAAAEAHALRDAARWLERARDTVELIPDASARLRFELAYKHACCVRAQSSRSFLPLAHHIQRLAREPGHIARAALLLEPPLGFPRLPTLESELAAALAGLPEDSRSFRAALMARLATSAPCAYDAFESGALLAQALQLAESSPEWIDRFSARLGELYLFGGPAHEPRAHEAYAALQRLCSEDPRARPRAPLLLELHRALIALQAGGTAASARTLESCAAMCRERDLELLWHVERFRALLRIQRGELVQGRDALLELHRRARGDEPILGTELFIAYDRSVVLGAAEHGSAEQRVLTPQASDPPNLWALKVRALAARGEFFEARSGLALVAPERLRALPCDQEYLGTLGALARAALQLCAMDYARVIYELLAPYPEYFAVNSSFVCEGSVSHLLGMLARSFGELNTARRHFKAALAASEKAGLRACATDAQLELAASAERSRVTA